MNKNILLGAAAVGVLITGAIAQTSSNIERIKDPAGQQNTAPESEPKKNVRTVYPNTQNAEQAAQQSKSAQGQADAGKRKAGDVTPLPNAPQPSAQQQQSGQVTTPAAPPAQAPQQNAQTPSAPASTMQSPSVQGTQSAQPASALPSTTQQPAPTATAAQSAAPSSPPAAEMGRASSGVISLDTQQQTSIGQAIAQRAIKPLSNANFSIAVGTKVPSAVQLRALPSDVVTFVPQYRGYSFVAIEEQIVIVDPGTHEIVAIVPYAAAAPATRTVETPKPRAPAAEKPMTSRSVNLNTEGQAVSRSHATEQRKKPARSASNREYREERLPRTVTVEEFAEPNRVPVIRERRLFEDAPDEVIVAPRLNGFFGLFR